jgi:DNA-binding NtrC family response regulator
MSIENFSGKVLFVDDESIMRGILSREAQRAGVEDFELFEDAPGAVARIENLDEAAAAIFSDGLNGGWRSVITAAKEARIPAFVVSGDKRIRQEVEASGSTFLLKQDLALGFVEAALIGLQNPSEA